MKIKSGFELRDVAGENVLMATGAENVNFSNIISLNESAAYLWKKIAENGSVINQDQMVQWLLDIYEIDEQTASKDVKSLIESWKQADIVI